MKMLPTLVAAAGLLALAAPAHAVADPVRASSGLTEMSKLNLIVFGDAKLQSEVEGKAYIGGSLDASSAPIGTGASDNGQGFTASNKFATLTVGGAVTGNGVQVNNGIGLSTISATVGGNAAGVQMNLGNAASAKLEVGGSLNAQNFNPNAKKTAEYGTNVSNVGGNQNLPYITQDVSQANVTTGLKASIATEMTKMQGDLQNLSDFLAAMTPTAGVKLITSDQNNIRFDFGNLAAGSDYAVVNVDATQAAKLSTGTLKLANVGTTVKTLIVNVAGTTINYGVNPGSNHDALNQKIIWNFKDATTVNLSTNFNGSLLATKAMLKGNGPIEGSVVAKSFQVTGEVHLGTFAGNRNFLPPNPFEAIPEPGVWLQMILGFGLVGGMIRRGRRVQAVAARA